MCQQLHARRQSQRRQARHARGEQAQRRRRPASLAVQVDAEAPHPVDAERAVRDLRLLVDPPRVRRERRQDRLFDVLSIQGPFREQPHAPVYPD
jgi:hypothetical protein